MKGIIFTGESVRSIIAGTKTQTRRVLKQPVPSEVREFHPYCTGTKYPLAGYWRGGSCWNSTSPYHCPYGKPGDRLWVRETYEIATMEPKGPEDVIYRADDNSDIEDISEACWKSPLFMPRRFARIWLEITDIRVERLQDISEEDAKAEGCYPEDWRKENPLTQYGQWMGEESQKPSNHNYRNAYRRLWESVNGKKHPWESNPFVWAITFKQVEPCRAST